MELKSVTGESLSLEIINYEFPLIDNWLDGNWLLIRGEVNSRQGSWTFIDPSLTVEEAHILGRWLKTIAENKFVSINQKLKRTTLLLFAEPNLSFRLIKKTKLLAELDVIFTLESLPPWMEKSVDGIYPEFVLNLKIPTKFLLKSANNWLDRLKLFPERG